MTRTTFAVLLLVAGCQSAAPRGGLFDPARAAALSGNTTQRELEARFGGVLPDRAAEQRMEQACNHLLACRSASVPHGSCHLLDTPEANAFSLPGPRIYITRGLYVRLATDDVLTAVMAHELAHVTAHDHFKKRCPDARTALRREVDADAWAVNLLREAGIPPEAMAAAVAAVRPVLPRHWAEARIRALADLHTR